MTRWIVGSSLKFRLLILAAAVAMLVVGISQLRDMPVDVLPEYGPPTVEVQTEALGLSAAEVEQLVTVPLEADLLNGVAFLEDIRSESITGLSRILLVFEPGTDLYRARQVVAERVHVGDAREVADERAGCASPARAGDPHRLHVGHDFTERLLLAGRFGIAKACLDFCFLEFDQGVFDLIGEVLL